MVAGRGDAGAHHMLMALMLQSAALATATSALGFTEWHWLFKPLTMAIAIF